MATPAHCVYCFDTLAASLDDRRALTLRQVEDLWAQYRAAQLGDLEDEDNVLVEEASDPEDEPIRSLRPRPRLNQLAVPSPQSGSSSSSTPSSMSTSSSRTGASTLASSNNSSSSSFFSFARRQNTRLERPLFVTWSTMGRSGSKSLRGCIGTFEPQELESGLQNYALTSAFDDSRFMPIAKRELRHLEVGVTLLTDFESAPTPTSWDLGKHGLRISFSYHSRRYGATYLPDVPVEQGWTKEETLISLMRKAGWTGRKDDWRKVSDLRVVRYQGKKVTMGYEEWKAWRQWAEQEGLV